LTLCFITNRRLYGEEERIAQERLLEAIAAAARAGVHLIQIRERDLAGRVLLRLVRRALAAVAGTPTRVLVNDRADVAIAAAADGVHLRGDSFAAPRVREITTRTMVGRSVQTTEEAAAVEALGGCDYLIAGTVFPTPSKPAAHALLGVEGLRGMCRTVSLPVLAVGGIGMKEAAAVARAGASGIAAIRLFAEASTVGATVHRLRTLFDTDPEVV
jgi:thiamine-phosphate pyrophosphorylase